MINEVENTEELNVNDYVIDENFKLCKIKAIDHYPNGNIKYWFTTNTFRLKDEKHLGNPNKTRLIKINAAAIEKILDKLTQERDTLKSTHEDQSKQIENLVNRLKELNDSTYLFLTGH